MTTLTHIKTCDAIEATLYSTEQKLLGWVLTSGNPESEWQTVKRINPAKVTVFARKALALMHELDEAGRMNACDLMAFVLNRKRDRFFTAWLFQCLKAGSVYVSHPPTITEQKEVGIL